MKKPKKSLRSGITTGACAAAAAKAAILAHYFDEAKDRIEIKNLEGKFITVEIIRTEKFPNRTISWVLKDGGDDPDITHGLEIGVEVQDTTDLTNSDEKNASIRIFGGVGVGVVTRPGLQVAVGEPAINPVPRKMLEQAALEALPKGRKVALTVTVPKGEEAAKKTLNPRLGIVGGISILGTTGIVRPMSEDAFKESLVPQITMAAAHGFDTVVLTPGGIGEKQAIEKYGFPALAVIQMSNFVGFMLQACVEHGIKKAILFGHHSKLLKVAGGSFHTHNKISDGRLEVLACYAGIYGAQPEIMTKILETNTAEEALTVVKECGLVHIFAKLAERASKKAEAHIFDELEIGTMMLDLKGELLGSDEKAQQIGEELGWQGQLK